MRRGEVIFTAVMATVIAHLIVAIIFMSLKISALKSKVASEVYITLEQEIEEQSTTEKDIEEMTQDEIAKYASLEQIVNIAKNIADEPMDIDPAEYQDRVKDELIKSGQLSESNYIDEKKGAEAADDEEIAVVDKEQKPVEVLKKKEKYTTFRGPTRIFYELSGRHHTYLPIPIYKCEGAGQISLSIEVDRQGNVLSATPASKLSTTSDECLTETAVTYALKTKFNSDESAPSVQKGFLTFVFVSQKK